MNTTTTMPTIAPAALHPEHIIPTPWRDYTTGFHRCKGVKRLGSSICLFSSTMPLTRCQAKLEALSRRVDNSRRCDDVNSGSFSHSSRASSNSSMIAFILASVRSLQSPLQCLSHHSRHRSHPGQKASILAFVKQHSSRYSPTVLNLLPSRGSQRKTLRMSPPF